MGVVRTPAELFFEGTWKIDITMHQASSEAMVFQIPNGTFTCETCTPP
jgi:hypothetical protein